MYAEVENRFEYGVQGEFGVGVDASGFKVGPVPAGCSCVLCVEAVHVDCADENMCGE